MFEQKSYQRHSQWYDEKYPTHQSRLNLYNRVKPGTRNNIGHWLQQQFFNCLNPLLAQTGNHWLTVGDAYGLDAQYITNHQSRALATDLTTGFLEVAQSQGIIEEYAAENAEQLSFMDNEFDYVLCKEAYHHFPRPYAALYEMIRVARKAIVVIEPQDPVLQMPLLLLLSNLLPSKLLNWVWKNRFSHEPVGNFVYKTSEREFEKFAAGLNLPLVAFKKLNPNFYFTGAENEALSTAKFARISIKKRFLDLLIQLKLIPAQVLCTIVFKQMPHQTLLSHLKTDGYKVVTIPKNPYV